MFSVCAKISLLHVKRKQMFHRLDNNNEVSCRVCVIDLVPCARYFMLYSDCFVVLFDPPLSWKVPEDREDVRTEGRQRFIL